MKVVKQGHWNDPWFIEVVCSNTFCETTLEIEERDVIAGYGPNHYEIRCCVCGRTTAVTAERIHLRVRECADKRKR